MPSVLKAASIALLALAAVPSFAAGVYVPGNSGPSFVDAGTYPAGTVLSLTATGTVDLVGNGYLVNPNGSLAGSPTDPTYGYARSGEAYSQAFGGDGTNRFAGGGANFDAYAYSIGYSQSPFADAAEFAFGYAGKKTTDTTDPGAIRLGSLIGTFSPNPTRADWFLVGSGASVVSTGGALRLAVNEGYHQNNSGGYDVGVQAVPEPSAFAALGLGALGLLRRRKRA